MKLGYAQKRFICAFVRRGEELSEEYSIKRTKFKEGKKLLVWAAISFDGPEQLYFIEDKKNTDV
jgi:hypothetical protein